MIVDSQCYSCRWFNVKDLDKNSCKAFPKGIPMKLLFNLFDHTHSYKGDDGIRFENKWQEETEKI